VKEAGALAVVLVDRKDGISRTAVEMERAKADDISVHGSYRASSNDLASLRIGLPCVFYRKVFALHP